MTQPIRNPPILNQSAISNQQSAIPLLSWPVWPHVYTMIVVMIGWVFFRADTLAGAVAFLKAMAGVTPAAPTAYTVGWFLTPELWLALVAGAVGSTPWVPALAARLALTGRERPSLPLSLVNTAVLAGLLFASILQLAARTYNPFIYFRF
jgi:alginate O-acetyltransferase complex protein AlgI